MGPYVRPLSLFHSGFRAVSKFRQTFEVEFKKADQARQSEADARNGAKEAERAGNEAVKDRVKSVLNDMSASKPKQVGPPMEREPGRCIDTAGERRKPWVNRGGCDALGTVFFHSSDPCRSSGCG